MGPESKPCRRARTDARSIVDSRNRAADAGGGDVHASALPCSTTLVSPPAMLTPARSAASAMARTSASRIGGQAGFENEGDHHRFGTRAGNRQIVHGAVDGQFADGAAGKRRGLTTKLSVVIATRGSVDFEWAASPEVRMSCRKAAARTGLRPDGGWLCRRRRGPFRSAGRESGSWAARLSAAIGRRRSCDCADRRHQRLPVFVIVSTLRMSLPKKP